MKHVIGWICLLALLFSAVASAQTKKITYYYTDPQGNVLAEADEQGNVTKTYDYKPYGSGAMGALDDGPSYTGHVNDSDTGLLYMQARYQDPVTGRFLSVDPESISSGNVSSFNRYSYAVNNPYTHTDPSGRCVEDLCIGESIVLCAATPCGAVVAAAVAEIGAITVAAFAINDEPVTVHQETHSDTPALPGSMVGTNDSKSRQQGGRFNSGPLSPEHGGTGDSVKDFDTLTGGKSAPAAEEKEYPPGTLVGENGISHRPATPKYGPRIDIPANGDKVPETLHYPKLDVQSP